MWQHFLSFIERFAVLCERSFLFTTIRKRATISHLRGSVRDRHEVTSAGNTRYNVLQYYFSSSNTLLFVSCAWLVMFQFSQYHF